MQNSYASPVAVAIPPDARVNGCYSTTQLADAYAINLPPDVATDPEQLARFMFESQPAWAEKLMALRDIIVARLGLKTAEQLGAPSADSAEKRIAIFKVYESTPVEVLLGEDDSHLNFRISVQVRPATASHTTQLVISTVVHCHNLVGRGYIALITPFHRAIVKAALRRAARLGWPRLSKIAPL